MDMILALITLVRPNYMAEQMIQDRPSNNTRSKKGATQKAKSQSDNNSGAARRSSNIIEQREAKVAREVNDIYNSVIKSRDLVPSMQKGNEMKKQMDALRKDIIKQVAVRNDAPLQNAGSLLTGPIADVIHQLVNPGKAPVVPYPGQNPQALGRANVTPFKSIPLLEGRANVITTPLGKYQIFRSQTTTVEVDPTNFTLYKQPVQVLTVGIDSNNTNQVVSSTTIFGQGETGKDALFLTGTKHCGFWNQLRDATELHPASLILDIPPTLYHARLELYVNGTYQNFDINATGLSCIGLGAHSAATCPPNIDADHYYACVPAPAATQALVEQITFSNFVESNLPKLIRINYNRFASAPNYMQPFIVPQSLENYLAVRVPQLQQLSGGGLNTCGGFIAASTIITSDASAISNGGFIYGASINDVPLVSPSYMTFSDWISNRTNWFYKGQLRKGMYQIYVPEQIELEENNDTTSCPWFSEKGQYYSMVFIIDNSFSPSGGPLPLATQAHVTWESVYSTSAAGNILPLTSEIKDIGWDLALSVLRNTYEPTGNELHLDAMKDWAHKTFSTLANYGSRIIQSPVTKDIVSQMITKGVPLIAEGISSLL